MNQEYTVDPSRPVSPDASPADAEEMVRRRADYVSPRKGGEGAVRDAVVHILRHQGRFEALVEQVYGAKG